MSGADALLDRAREQGTIGELAFRRGDHAASAQALEAGLALLDRAREQGTIGELAFRRGDHAASAQALEAGLALLGRKVPRRPLAAVLLELARRAGPRRVEASEADRVSAHLHGLLTFPYYF